jgi:rod shape-determining protein MreC
MPILQGVHWVKSGVKRVVRRYFYLVNAATENEELRKELAASQLRQGYYDKLTQENERLANYLNFKASTPFRVIPAKVIAYPPLGEFRILVLDRGSEQEVQRGAPVLTQLGLVGRIQEVAPNYSKVLLITDPSSAVDARVKRTGARGLVVGHGQKVGLDRELFIGAFEFWDHTEEVSEGDELVTSGLDGVFPANIPIGTVRETRREKFDVFQKGKVIPFVIFNKTQEVFIVK